MHYACDRWLVGSFVHSFIQPFRAFVHSFIQTISCIRSLIHSTISRIHSFIHSVCIRSSLNFARYTNSKFRGPNAVTWGVFVNEEVLQPTVVDHEAFMVWKDEAFSLWLKEWASIYDPDSRAAALIHSIHDTHFLVSVVDNDFMHGNIYAIFDAVEQLQAPQLQLAAAAARCALRVCALRVCVRACVRACVCCCVSDYLWM